jgi:hypothetical protein
MAGEAQGLPRSPSAGNSNKRGTCACTYRVALTRYGAHHLVARSISCATAQLIDIVERVENRGTRAGKLKLYPIRHLPCSNIETLGRSSLAEVSIHLLWC